MKKKIVIKLSICCDKCRRKALKIAAEADGVISVALEGDDKEKLVVIGERVDAACLTKSLRKKLNCADLVSIEEIKPPVKPPEKPPVKPPPQKPPPEKPPPPCYCYCARPQCELLNLVVDPNPPPCIIM